MVRCLVRGDYCLNAIDTAALPSQHFSVTRISLNPSTFRNRENVAATGGILSAENQSPAERSAGAPIAPLRHVSDF